METAAAETKKQNAIEVQGLTKRFGNVTALNNMTFSVPEGVIAGFVGPNGSGKTTTMRVLTTLLRQDSGQAKVFGWDTSSKADGPKVRHALGFMPDYFGLYNDMTCAEYLDFFAAAYRIEPAKRKGLVADILALLNLTEKLDSRISGLSRGMQQKLTLGRCLVHSPRLLLLDEPASGLDPRARIELMELLRELRTMGKTIFISSHILSELHHLCDMVVIIEKGATVYSGSLADASAGVMEGRDLLELTVQGDPDAAAAILGSIAGVTAIRRRQQVLVAEISPPLSSAALIEECVKRGLRLDEARRSSANLEDVFMHLTEQQDQ